MTAAAIPEAAAAIRTEGLGKHYGAAPAVRDLDLTVERGEIFGFLGPNGAGKTTTIGMLTTTLAPTYGRAWVAGFDVAARPHDVRRHIGLVFQETTLDADFTAAENLEFQAELFGVPKRAAPRLIDELLALVELHAHRDTLVRTFSGGMRRRLEIVRGLMHGPRVLFLDEPTTGLDPQTRTTIWEYLHRLRREQGTTIFLTTHQLEEAEHCDRIAIMDVGSLVARGTPVQLKAVIGADLVELSTGDDEAAARALRSDFGLEPEATAHGLRIRVRDGSSVVPALCAGIGVPVRSVTVTPPTLDDVFLHYTGHTIRDTGTAPQTLATIATRR